MASPSPGAGTSELRRMPGAMRFTCRDLASVPSRDPASGRLALQGRVQY